VSAGCWGLSWSKLGWGEGSALELHLLLHLWCVDESDMNQRQELHELECLFASRGTEPCLAASKLHPTRAPYATLLTAEFRNLPDPLLRRALDTLVKRAKAQILRDGEGDGVRFL